MNGGDADLGRTLQGLGNVLVLEGRYALAAHLHRRAVALLEGDLGPRDPDVGLALRDLGFALRRDGQHKEAKPAFERALSLLRARYGPEHPYVTETQVELGSTLWGLHDVDGALGQLGGVLPFLVRAYGPDHPKVAFAMTQLGAVLGEKGEVDRAIPLLERALQIRRTALGAAHPDVGNSLLFLGRMHWLRGDLREALSLLDQAEALLAPAVGPGHPDLSVVYDCRAGVLSQMGRLPEARDAYRRAVALRDKAQGAKSLALYMPLFHLARIEQRLEDWAGAEVSLRRLVELGEAYPQTRHMTAMPQVRLAQCLVHLGRYAEAEPLLLSHANEKAEAPVRREAADVLAQLYAAWGRPAEAARYRALWKSLPATETLASP